jgi:20S proteasome alpha/beta subunit
MLNSKYIKTVIGTIFLTSLVGIQAPVAKSQTERQEPSLAETVWAGNDSEGKYYVYKFQSNGKLDYTSPTGSFSNGKWSQHNSSVYFHMNDHYSEYLGVVKGNRMVGKAWNIAGYKWTWKVTKQ